jgi:small-conductance mechanosensitive channel
MAGFNLTQVIEQTLGTNAMTSEILASIVLFVLVAVIGSAVYFVFNHYFSKLAAKTETTLDDDILDAVKSFVVIIVVILGIEYALAPLSFLQAYMGLLNQIFMIVEIFLIAFAITRVSNIVADWYGDRLEKSGKGNKHLLFMLKKIVQVVVFVGAFIAILFANSWVNNGNLQSLALSAGAGSIALAFALQSTLTDFFSAFSIYIDRPFEIGDFITVGDFSGNVVNIGVKSTRVKLMSGEELVLSNKELNSASVRNFRKLDKRRISFVIGITYETPTEKMKQIPFIIKDIFKGIERAELSRVHFTEFGDFALKYAIVYFVNSAEYGEYLDIQQYVNLGIKEAFEREGIEFAYPTNVIYVKKEAASSKAVPNAKAAEAEPLPNFSS